MAIEVGLADGTKLTLANREAIDDAVVDSVLGNPDGVMTLLTDDGAYRVLIRHVVYVRTIGD